MVILAVSMPGKIYMLPLFKKIGERVGEAYIHIHRDREIVPLLQYFLIFCVLLGFHHILGQNVKEIHTNTVGMGALFVTHLRYMPPLIRLLKDHSIYKYSVVCPPSPTHLSNTHLDLQLVVICNMLYAQKCDRMIGG